MKRLIGLALLWAGAAFGQIAYTDFSGTIASGGVSQTLAAASSGRVRIAILNPATETENLCVNLTAAASCTAGGSWVLQAGQSIVIDSTEAITVVAATTGHKYTAKAGVGAGFAANGGGSGGAGGGDATAANQTTQISHESRLTSSAGPNTAGAALSTTAFQVGCRYLTAPATMTNGQEAGCTFTTDQQLRAATTAADGSNVALGATTDAAATAGSTGTVSAKLRLATTQLAQLHTDITAANTQLPSALGQTTASGSLSIVQASDATAIAAQGSTTSGQKVNLAGCATTAAAPSNTTAQTNAINCDTGGGLRVTTSGAATGTASSVASSATDVTCLASNTARKGATVFNDSTAILYLLLANAVSSTTNYTVQVAASGYYEVPFAYTGVIKCIWASATGNARVTEITN